MSDWSWLGYPQVVLTLWCPVVVLGAWRLAGRWRRRLAPRERFFLAATAALVPALALFVPYLPGLALRDALPWRAPIAWGVTSAVGVGQVTRPVAAALTVLWVLPLLSLAVSFACGGLQARRASVRARRLPVVRDAGYGVVHERGFVASSVGLLRPRVLVGIDVVEASAVDAVVEHERCHCRHRHALWVFLATCALRAWWWVPGRRAVLAELALSGELWADDDARARHGAAAVARALSVAVGARSGPSPMGVAAFTDPGRSLLLRVEALGAPAPVRNRGRAWAVRASAVCLAGVVVVLL
ncbi:M56 family metallopeptidase [Quadrisphaera setariae]|uniref:M56 family metallopeptidase n=1 Tax=Quadrisphaera setariae TaxID=2593304 RepID=A0A5C8ZJ88_9ACTN|nr:M56 family metallopeptidase [Quadrisphaera setariae]TXR56986.1 M56 family metallopeptidase [Quadrisphaera setariae]